MHEPPPEPEAEALNRLQREYIQRANTPVPPSELSRAVARIAAISEKLTERQIREAWAWWYGRGVER